MLLFSGAVVASAFFLFLIQPLLAKQILPWFGGTAAVWSVCLVFYQGVLLGGYLYAHALARFLSLRQQAYFHLGVLGLSVLSLPIGLSGIGQPSLDGSNPSASIVWVLLRAVGLPYFVLSTTSPLLQHWYAQVEPHGKAYRLFGWSNLSCAVALLSFPFLLEPWLPLSLLNRFWSAGYALVALLIGLVAWRTARSGVVAGHDPAIPASPWLERVRWLGYSALGSALLLGVTSYLCQTVAPIPFLWTVPLLLYLLSFVAVFEREWYTRQRGLPCAAFGLAGVAWTMVRMPSAYMLSLGLPIICIGFFCACFFCHGELALRKPDPARLTEFYILLAAGGALGSLLVTFVAPVVFTSYVEFPLTLVLCAFVLLFTFYGRHWKIDAVAALAAVLVCAPALGAWVSASRGRIAGVRNFYGSLRVVDEPAPANNGTIRKILHGSVVHGAQFQDAERRNKAITYYGPDSGAGFWFRHTAPPRNVGIIGLGAGSLAAYGRAGDRFRFYEINPLVVDLARQYFTFLSDTPAKVEVLVGDGRLLLAAEPPQNFDLLVVDAFSGDSIPLHLLTRESFELYLRHLKPGGILALHLSNLYLQLQDVVRAQALSVGRSSLPLVNVEDAATGVGASSWALVASPAILEELNAPKFGGLNPGKHTRPWTDDYSTLLAALF